MLSEGRPGVDDRYSLKEGRLVLSVAFLGALLWTIV